MAGDRIQLMIVDDEVVFVESTRKRLEIRGFDVKTATSGAEALEKAGNERVDIALLDLKMPGMSGEETLEALKKAHPNMEIIILTGHGSVDSAVSTVRTGAFSYLQKPCRLEKLLESITEAYKKYVANKMQINEDRMNELLSPEAGEAPEALLGRLLKLGGDS